MPSKYKPTIPSQPTKPNGMSTEDWLKFLAGAGVRTAGPWLGGIAGGTLGSMVGPEGTVAGAVGGAAAGGAAGEYLAELIGGQDPNLGRMGVAGALGAIPGSWMIRGGKPLLSAGLGAGVGYLGVAGDKVAQGESVSKAINPMNWSSGELLGPALGGAIGGAFGKYHTKAPEVAPVDTPAPWEVETTIRPGEKNTLFGGKITHGAKGKETLTKAKLGSTNRIKPILSTEPHVPAEDIQLPSEAPGPSVPATLRSPEEIQADLARYPKDANGRVDMDAIDPKLAGNVPIVGTPATASGRVAKIVAKEKVAETRLEDQFGTADARRNVKFADEGTKAQANAEKEAAKTNKTNTAETMRDLKNLQQVTAWKNKSRTAGWTQEARNLDAVDQFHVDQAESINKALEEAAKQRRIADAKGDLDGPVTKSVTERVQAANPDGTGVETLTNRFNPKPPPDVEGGNGGDGATPGSGPLLTGGTPVPSSSFSVDQVPTREELVHGSYTKKEAIRIAKAYRSGGANVDVVKLPGGRNKVIFKTELPTAPTGPATTKFQNKVDDILNKVGEPSATRPSGEPPLDLTPPPASTPKAPKGSSPKGGVAKAMAKATEKERPFNQLSSKDQQDLIPILNTAIENGYSGDIEALGDELAGRFGATKDGRSLVADTGNSSSELLKAIRKLGGISRKAETAQKGEIDWLKEHFSGGPHRGSGIFNNKGLSLDDTVTRLKQEGKFGHINSIDDLTGALGEAATSERQSVLDELTNGLPKNWWKKTPDVEVSDYTGGQPEHTIEAPVPEGVTPESIAASKAAAATERAAAERAIPGKTISPEGKISSADVIDVGKQPLATTDPAATMEEMANIANKPAPPVAKVNFPTSKLPGKSQVPDEVQTSLLDAPPQPLGKAAKDIAERRLTPSKPPVGVSERRATELQSLGGGTAPDVAPPTRSAANAAHIAEVSGKPPEGGAIPVRDVKAEVKAANAKAKAEARVKASADKAAFAKANYSPEVNAELDELWSKYRSTEDPKIKRQIGEQISEVDKAELARLTKEQPVEPVKPVESAPSDPTNEDLAKMSKDEQAKYWEDMSKRFKGGSTLSMFGGGQFQNMMKIAAENSSFARVLSTGVGAATGAAMNPDDRLKGALVGGAAGAFAPTVAKALIGKIRSNPNSNPAEVEKVGSSVKDAVTNFMRLIPDYQRFTLLTHSVNLPMNM